MRPPSRAHAVMAAIAVIATSCAGPRTPTEPALPFHVAVIPFEVGALEEAEAATDGDVALALDPGEVSRVATDVLGRGCFARTTLLRPPAGMNADEFGRLPRHERDAHWMAQMRAVGADLLLEAELSWSPRVRSECNEKFWTNLPLFLLGGPACYFVDDVAYRGRARLSGDFHDVRALLEDRATLEDGRARLLHVDARFQEVSLDFLDRAGGNVGSYATSIVVPAGLLSHESRSAEAKLVSVASEDLARGFARAVREGAREILVADDLAGFHLDPRYELEIRGDRVFFRGEAVLRRGDLERMDSYSIRVGDREVTGEFADGVPDAENSTRRARYLRYPFEAVVPLESGADHATIELVAGGQGASVRTFTIAIGSHRRPNAPSGELRVASLGARE